MDHASSGPTAATSAAHTVAAADSRVDYFAYPPSRQPRSASTSTSAVQRSRSNGSLNGSTAATSTTSPETSSASSSKSTASTMSTSPESGPTNMTATPSTSNKYGAALPAMSKVVDPTTPFAQQRRRASSAGDITAPVTEDVPMAVDTAPRDDAVPLSGPSSSSAKVRRASELSAVSSNHHESTSSPGTSEAQLPRKRQARRPSQDYFSSQQPSSSERAPSIASALSPRRAPSVASAMSPRQATPQQQPQEPQEQEAEQTHVDIVNYPAADLLRRLAALLEQIAHTNDALARQRQLQNSGSGTPLRSDGSDDGMAGHFDAAPLNSPVASRSRLAPLTSITIPPRQPATPGVNLSTEHQLFEAGLNSRAGSRRASLDMTRRPPSMSSSLQLGEDSDMTDATTDENGQPALAAAPSSGLLTAASLALASPQATLCFHARNVPAISIEAYLQRILRYCPTTNEVFVSLLVYFDRMARIVTSPEARSPAANDQADGSDPASGASTPGETRGLIIDSYNVHRLIIAGITIASKFFSDVFYTNSRYAKVGGLPLTELNQLELQFLLLNNFDLYIPVEQLQHYADQLLLVWNGTNTHSATPQRAQRHPTPITVPSQQQQHQQAPSAASSSSTTTTNASATMARPAQSPSTTSTFSSSDTSGASTVTPGSTSSTPSTSMKRLSFGGSGDASTSSSRRGGDSSDEDDDDDDDNFGQQRRQDGHHYEHKSNDEYTSVDRMQQDS